MYVDYYAEEPEQPLYDDVQDQGGAATTTEAEGFYDSAQGYGNEEPEQPMYDDVQGAMEPEEPAQELYDDVQGTMEKDEPLYDDAVGEVSCLLLLFALLFIYSGELCLYVVFFCCCLLSLPICLSIVSGWTHSSYTV